MSKQTQTSKVDVLAYFKAANKGEVSKLKTLLQSGQKVDARNDSGKTALMQAAERGHDEVVRVLLAAGANVNATVSDRDSIWFGCNALIFAAESGKAELIERLISAGVSVHCKAIDGTTPVGLAVQKDLPRTVESLLKAGAPLPKEILVTSVWNNAAEISMLLIQAGADANAQDELGQSVLHKAAETGQSTIVRALIKAKAKVNPKASGTTPLLIAIQNGHTDCALELIRSGADLAATGLLRRDALMVAAVTGRTEIAKALLKAGSNTKAKDKEGKTALMLANEKEHTDIVNLLQGDASDDSGYKVQEYIRASMKGNLARVRQLLEEGVDVNATYQNGAKALISAIMNGHTDVVRLLLEWGANASTRSTAKAWGGQFHADALALAAEKGNLEIVRLLIKSGADAKRSRMFGMSCLVAAARGGHGDVIRELLGAGFSTAGNTGCDALETAIRRNKEEAAVVLLKHGVKPRGKFAANLLVSAAEKGMAQVIKALLDTGVDPKLRNEYDETALQAAKASGNRDILAMLQRARSPQESPGTEFVEAAERGDLPTVHRLILEGVDLETRDAKGATALIRATANCHLPVIKTLLKAGANPNASTHFAKRDQKKWFHHMDLTSETPLSCAASARCLPAVELLLDAGADINKSECGHVACMILTEGEKEGAALVERLLDAGMDPNTRWPVLNLCILEIAAEKNFPNLVEKLIHAGARLTKPLERDRAILRTIQIESVDIARRLIEQGISPQVKGVISAASLVTASESGLDEIVVLLLQHGVKIDGRIDTSFERDGRVERVTALMAAARFGHESVVRILLKAGANPKLEDAIGRTALDWAQNNRNEKTARKIVQLLETAATGPNC